MPARRDMILGAEELKLVDSCRIIKIKELGGIKKISCVI
jgi:hypothetical protein